MFEKLEENIGYQFKNQKFLEIALSHSSYVNEKKIPTPSNERQEFLGDSVLSLIVADYLFHNFYNLPEGELTKLRASLVCETSLREYSKKIDLSSFLLLGKGEEQMGGRERGSMIADAFEALLGAIYLDSDFSTARDFLLPFIKPYLNKNKIKKPFKDYKTELQEITQQYPEEQLSYVLVDQSGPDHDKVFTVELRLNSNLLGKGTGKSKKIAEQSAAKQALELMGEK